MKIKYSCIVVHVLTPVSDEKHKRLVDSYRMSNAGWSCCIRQPMNVPFINNSPFSPCRRMVAVQIS